MRPAAAVGLGAHFGGSSNLGQRAFELPDPRLGIVVRFHWQMVPQG